MESVFSRSSGDFFAPVFTACSNCVICASFVSSVDLKEAISCSYFSVIVAMILLSLLLFGSIAIFQSAIFSVCFRRSTPLQALRLLFQTERFHLRLREISLEPVQFTRLRFYLALRATRFFLNLILLLFF